MVKSIGAVRKMDELGRVIIPIDVRNMLGLQENDEFEILIDEEESRVILEKTSKKCIKCHSEENLKQIKPGFYICGDCIEKISV